MKYRAIMFSFALILVFSLTFSNSTHAQSSTSIDYVILMDTSESMMWKGNPPLFEQLQDVVIAFVDSFQRGANVTVYTFDQEVRLVGDWNNINDFQKQEIKEALSNLKAEGQQTRLWDAVCEGVNVLENSQRPELVDNQFQMLISFTDGLDNMSSKTKGQCVGEYIDYYHERGNILWIYNAINTTVPDIVVDNGDTIKIVASNVPEPIRITYLSPQTLRLGNLYNTGIADNQATCLFPYYSHDSMLGETVSLKPAYADDLGRQLPFSWIICGPGDSECPRTFEISEGETCLDISLGAFKPELLKPGEGGEYVYLLPVEFENESRESIFLVPEQIRLEFSLNSPTPTFTPTNTPTPTDTPTPTPTPKPTSVPPEVSCGGLEVIDLGKLSKPNRQGYLEKSITCTLDWQQFNKPNQIIASLVVDPHKHKVDLLPSDHLWISTGSGPAETLKIDPDDHSVDFGINIPGTIWQDLGIGEHAYSGKIVFHQAGVEIGENTDIEDTGLPAIDWSLSIYNPYPKWPYFGVGLLLIITGIFVTRPRFPLLAKYDDGSKERALQGFNPQRWWSGAVYVGGGPLSHIALGRESEVLLEIKPSSMHGSLIGKLVGQQENTEITITPLNGAKIEKLGGKVIQTGEELEVYGEEFTLIYEDQEHSLKIIPAESKKGTIFSGEDEDEDENYIF